MRVDCEKGARMGAFLLCGIAMHRSSRSNAGFTLLELVVTLVILGILSAYAAPRLLGSQAFEQRGYVDEVAAALRHARKIAVASGCEVSVTIGTASYAARQRSSLASCNGGAAPWTTPVRRSDGMAVAGTAPGGIQLSPARVIVYDPDGRATSGAPAAIVSGSFTISVDRGGMVTVQP